MGAHKASSSRVKGPRTHLIFGPGSKGQGSKYEMCPRASLLGRTCIKSAHIRRGLPEVCHWFATAGFATVPLGALFWDELALRVTILSEVPKVCHWVCHWFATGFATGLPLGLRWVCRGGVWACVLFSKAPTNGNGLQMATGRSRTGRDYVLAEFRSAACLPRGTPYCALARDVLRRAPRRRT